MINKDDYSVYLRAFEPDDYKLINIWRNDPKIQELTCGTFRYVSQQIEKAWVEDKMMHNLKDVYLAIITNDGNDKMIGYVSINDIDYPNRSAHGGGIVIGDKEYRDGPALKDTWLIVFDHVFNNLGLHRFTGACLESHKKSRLMMEMMGFQMEGVKRDGIFKFHRFQNICQYSILAPDYYSLVDNGGYSEINIAIRANQARINLKKVCSQKD